MNIIRKTLKKLGVPANLLGYEYLAYAVELVIRDRSYIHNITNRLYQDIAQEFGTTKSRVERAIRHAIEVSFINANCDLLSEFFGNTISYNSGRVTNSCYIATVAECIQEESVV